MKKLLLLLGCLIFIINLNAQNTDVYLNGDVSDLLSEGVGNVQININVEPTGTFSYSNTVYTDSNGFYSDEFQDAPDFGLVHVEMVDCDGSIISQQNWWAGDTTTFFNYFDFCQQTPIDTICSVFIRGDSLNFECNDFVTLYAEATGIPPFSYQWSDGSTDWILNAEISDCYSVIVTDATGCVVESNSFCVEIESSCCNVQIYAGFEADLTAIASGNNPSTFLWSTGETTQTIIPAEDGEYCVTATDDEGCVDADCYYYGIIDSCSIEISVLDTFACLLVNVNGIAPFTYQWDETDCIGPILCPPLSGTYCVTVTDATGCVAIGCGTIEQNCNVSIFEHVSSDGSRLRAEHFGTAPFIYEWSTGETVQTISPDTPGSYCVTLTDATGCVSEDCYIYTGENIDTLCSSLVIPWAEANCLQAIPLSSGINPYTFLWEDGSTSDHFCSNVPGTYCVTIVDGNGCESVSCAELIVEDCGVTIHGDSLNIECNDSVALTALTNGGLPPYQYLWNNGYEGKYLVANMSGCYSVTVVDATGCEASSYEVCIEIPDDCCEAHIQENPTGSLSASLFSNEVATYLWSTGETTEIIFPTTAGEYCVTLTDVEGCVASDCYYYSNGGVDTLCSTLVIPWAGEHCLQAIPLAGIIPYTYQWEDGSTADTFCPILSGTYCVTVVDAVGCVSADCGTITIGGVTECSVYIVDTVEVGLPILYTQMSGVAPFTYLWNTGETSNASYPTSSGDYCVSITDATGCQSVDCFYYDDISVQDSLCNIVIEMDTDSCLVVQATGTAPFNYNWWSHGLSGSTICPQASGNYCVIVTDADGCNSNACFYLNLGETEVGELFGKIYTNDSLNISGTVFLIEYDSTDGGTLILIDTVPIETDPSIAGSYYFGNVKAGNYLVKVALDENSPGYENYLPTYYGDVLFWDEANFAGVPNDFFTANIHMIEGDNPGGPGFIGGLVIEGANFTGFADTRDGEGDPIAGIEIILLDMEGNPIAYTYTNAEGEYEFDDLAWGTYQVVVEIPGMEQAIYEITIGPNNPSETNIIFEVDEDSVALFTTSIEELLDANQFKLFPNPTSDQLTIEMDMKTNAEIFISLMTIDGRKVLETVKNVDYGLNRVKLDLANYQDGVYLMTIINGTDIISRKVIKQ